MDGQKEGRMEEQTNRRTDGQPQRIKENLLEALEMNQGSIKCINNLFFDVSV